MTFISYAQNFEDVMLWRALGGVGPGFYIDVGAAHPDVDSVTRAFYDRGWAGVNVEPVAASARRLAAARQRDVTLQVALGEAPGRAAFFVVGVGGDTGLSTLVGASVDAFGGREFDIERTEVEVDTLAAVCRRHARGPIHFLKVDVEGAEGAVLAGGDFGAFRPWVVVVEATAPMSTIETHGAWEGVLLGAGYRFVWFDGLNRFYLAEERVEALGRHFRTPPNVFDGFVRAADSEGARRLGQAEALQADAASRARAAEERAEALALRLSRQAVMVAELEGAVRREGEAGARLRREREAQAGVLRDTDGRLEAALGRVGALEAHAAALQGDLEEAQAWLGAMRGSTSWRVTAPLRLAAKVGRRGGGEDMPGRRPLPCPAAAAPRDVPPEVLAPPEVHGVARGVVRVVHQFHSGSAPGDAITNAMLMTRRLLREAGYRSEIFVEHVAPALAEELRPFEALPRHDGYVLLVRHSMGQGVMERLLALPAAKVLMYHNITPPRFLGEPGIREAARRGREQLGELRPHVVAALADSAFNALELRGLGFDPVRTCTLLIDPAAIAVRAGPPASGGPFTVLFVGRVIESKGQLELVESFARFVHPLGAASRLVLVGHHGGVGEAYFDSLQAAVQRHGIGAQVVLTGGIPDAERDGWYAAADLYVSLSHHEGFGVPLVEAMAHGIPVLAWPAGAVADTLGGAGELLEDAAPSVVAARMLALARDPLRRAAMGAAGRGGLERFAPAVQMPRLIEALVRAGAAPLPDAGARAALAATMRFAVIGPVAGEGRLAVENRALAEGLEAAWPGRVRVLPGEGGAGDRKAGEGGALRLAGRAAPETGPEVVMFRDRPVRVPAERGDLVLAWWDEVEVPEEVAVALSGFHGVLAARPEVARALADAGVAGVRLVRVDGVAASLREIALDLLTAAPGVGGEDGAVGR